MPPPLIDALALALAACGVGSALALIAATGRWREAVKAGLDLWLAAGLLRLAAPPSWTRLATAASIVLIRKLVVQGLNSSIRKPV